MVKIISVMVSIVFVSRVTMGDVICHKCDRISAIFRDIATVCTVVVVGLFGRKSRAVFYSQSVLGGNNLAVVRTGHNTGSRTWSDVTGSSSGRSSALAISLAMACRLWWAQAYALRCGVMVGWALCPEWDWWNVSRRGQWWTASCCSPAPTPQRRRKNPEVHLRTAALCTHR